MLGRLTCCPRLGKGSKNDVEGGTLVGNPHFFEKAKSVLSIKYSLCVQISGKYVHARRKPAFPAALTTTHLYLLLFFSIREIFLELSVMKF